MSEQKPSARSFAAGKFSPPVLDPQRHLPRTRIIGVLRQAEARGRRIFLILGRAGQGKTTLAREFLRECAAPFLWYQVTEEDRDPLFFCAALLEALRRSPAKFRSPLLEAMLDKGELAPGDAERAAGLLAADLADSHAGSFFFVFDDLHLLDGFPAGLAFFSSLLQTLPVDVRVLGLSRWALPLSLERKRLLVLDNETLALNRQETVALYDRLFALAPTGETLDLAVRRSEGWIMGLVLIGRAFARFGESAVRNRLHGMESLGQEQAEEFFGDEVLSGLDGEMRHGLLRLALFDDLPLPLIARVSEDERLSELLAELSRQNLFVRAGEDGRAYLFHHLFRDSLRKLGQRELAEEERQGALVRGGRWYLEEGRVEDALAALAEARDYPACAALLRDFGMALLGRNRLKSLETVLGTFPEAVMDEYAVFAFYYGMCLMDSRPERANTLLEQARCRFAAAGESRGELLASAQLILFHIFIDGRFNLAAPLLARAEGILTGLASTLPPVMLIQVSQALATGYYFLHGDGEAVRRHAGHAWDLAKAQGYDNLRAGITIIQGYHHAVRGHWESFRAKAEEAHELLANPRVSPLHRLSLRLMQLNLLSLQGDLVNYHRQRAVIEEIFSRDLLVKTTVGPLFWVLDIDVALAEGRLDEAESFVRMGLDSGYAAGNPHLRGMYRQYQAFLLALAERRPEALAAVDEALALRDEAGGRLFTAINRMILGAACARIGEPERAERLLEEAIRLCDDLDEHFTRIGALAFRGLLRLSLGRTEDAAADIRGALAGLRSNHLRHFYLATPSLLQEFLAAAGRLGIEVETARVIAARQLDLALLDKGRILPRLRIRTLGSLVMSLDRRMELREGVWSPAQRAFWALLLSAKEQSLPQERIQLGLWPESPADKSRASFDTLLSRARRVLDAACHPLSAKNYLELKRGVLSLTSCHAEDEDFSEEIVSGLRLARQGRPWQAGNCLYRGLRLWRGGYLRQVEAEDEELLARRSELERLYLQGVLAWGGLLVASGREGEALDLYNEALRVDPTQHDLVKALYELHSRASAPTAARRVLEQYRRALARADYEPDEIDAIVESLWTVLPENRGNF
ncbi:MAG: AAA family ATPase [Trichloromonas sp.]|nr:AAA family ATPase [Trichloromonas sp.]